MHTSLEATAPLLRGGWKSGEQGVVRFVWQRWFDYQQKLCQKRSFFAFTRAINVFKQEYKLNENINSFQKNGFESLVLNCIWPFHSTHAVPTRHSPLLTKPLNSPASRKPFKIQNQSLSCVYAQTYYCSSGCISSCGRGGLGMRWWAKGNHTHGLQCAKGIVIHTLWTSTSSCCSFI